MSPGRARQGDLFSAAALPERAAASPLPPPLLRQQLLDWQGRLSAHQAPLFSTAGGPDTPGGASQALQGQLFTPAEAAADPTALAAAFDPLSLRAQSLSFWRWPSAPQRGAAIYLVLDRPEGSATPLVLYVGETGCADRRWKGEHDCKIYLAAYSEALGKAGLATAPSIRFWCDVPEAIRARRALEQALIRRWLPPFNKESRERWVTPFTAELA